MKQFYSIDEASLLAKAALNRAAKKDLIEARILGQNLYKKLYFFFERVANVEYFKQNKEQIKENLRAQYRKKLALYKQENFIFYDIEARLGNEIKHRSKEEELTLQRGIAKLRAILDKSKADKVSAIVDKNRLDRVNGILGKSQNKAKVNAIIDKGKLSKSQNKASVNAIIDKSKFDKANDIIDKSKFAKLNAIVDKSKLSKNNVIASKKLVA